MSPRRTTVPPTRRHSRSSPQGRKELIARKKDEKQPAKRRTVLDDRFHRTDHSLAASGLRARVPDSRKLAKREALQRRASVRPLVGCSEKLGGRSFHSLEEFHDSCF